MTKKNKKGFTLTELIVVIAIIAILAVVLIPTSISFINKANKSNDVQLAAQMTKDLSYYCIENDIDQNEITGIDIKTILSGKGYSLIPSKDKWTYVYNENEKKVEVKEFDKGILAEGSRSDLTEVVSGFFLLGKGNSEIEKAVSSFTLGNLSSITNEEMLKSYPDYKTFVSDNYSYDHVLYINSFGVLNPPVTSSTESYSKVVLCENTNYVPNISIEQDYIDKIGNDTVVENKNILFVVAGDGNLQQKLQEKISIKNTVELDKLSSSVVIILPEDKTDAEKLEMEEKLDYTYTGDYSVNYLIPDYLTEEEINEISFQLGDNINQSSHVNISISRIDAANDVWKMSILFTSDTKVIGYKEIFFIKLMNILINN